MAETEGPTDDGFQPVFTGQDKQRLRNIQVIQLQRDYPKCRDYYGLMTKMKNVVDQDVRRRYMTTLHPKYRLGHVQEDSYQDNSTQDTTKFLGMGMMEQKRRSFQVPRKSIEDTLCPRVSQAEDQSEENYYRGILLKIEKLYQGFLIIEENEMRLGVLNYGSPFDANLKRDAKEMVANILDDQETLLNILNVFKGKMIVCRLVPVLERSVATKLFSFILRTIPNYWKDLSREQLEQSYNLLKVYVLEANENDMKLILESLTDSIIPKMGSSLLGMSLIMVILYRGDKLWAEAQENMENPKTAYFCELWINKCVDIISLLTFMMEDIATPIEVYRDFCTSVIETANHYLGEGLQENFLQILKTIFDNGSCTIVPEQDDSEDDDQAVHNVSDEENQAVEKDSD